MAQNSPLLFGIFMGTDKKKASGMSQDWTLAQQGIVRDLNQGPLAPWARIIPIDQRALYEYEVKETTRRTICFTWREVGTSYVVVVVFWIIYGGFFGWQYKPQLLTKNKLMEDDIVL